MMCSGEEGAIRGATQSAVMTIQPRASGCVKLHAFWPLAALIGLTCLTLTVYLTGG